jgi:hypothetical protein
MSFQRFLTAFAVAATPLCISAARANVVFDWEGACTVGCSGTAKAVLTLTDAYVFGDPVTSTSFVSLAYTSSDITVDFPPPLLFTGGLNADGPITSLVFIIRGTSGSPQFNLDDTGTWELATAVAADAGVRGFFFPSTGSAIPEPSTWAMMLLGFAGLGFAGYWKTRNNTRLSSPV